MAKHREFKWQSYVKELTDSPPFSSQWEHDFARIVCANLDPETVGEVLEVGCSNGRWLRWFSGEYRCRNWGLDRNSEGLESGGDSGFLFTVGDALSLPHQDMVFDVVFSLGLVEHFQPSEKYRLLAEQQRVLKPGGYLICQVPLLSTFSLNYLYVKWAYDWRKGTVHFKTTRREFEGVFRKLGLTLVFSGLTGCLFDTARRMNLHRTELLKRLFATEILIIGRKSDRN